jgi:predicted nucleic acid-binding protein
VSEAFVADSSIGVSWVHPNQRTDAAGRLLEDVQDGSVVHVASLWPLEVANSLVVAVRRRAMTEQERRTALLFLSRLSFVIDSEASALAWTTVSDLAMLYGLSVYDAVYLELAMRKQLPLASRDGPLRSAASRAGVELL